MPVVSSPRDLRLVSPGGSAVIFLRAGVPRKLSETMAIEARRKGAVILPGEDATEPTGEPMTGTAGEEVAETAGGGAVELAGEPVAEPETPDRIIALVDAMRVIYNSGDAEKLTRNGEPRAKALEELTGFAATAEERAQAQEQYDTEYGGES